MNTPRHIVNSTIAVEPVRLVCRCISAAVGNHCVIICLRNCPRSDNVRGEPNASVIVESSRRKFSMAELSDRREGEVAVKLPPASDAGLIFIGRIRTPWPTRADTPKQGKVDGPVCSLEIFE